MHDETCIAFLQWCLPRLGLRWRGYRKVRRTVCKRVRRRIRELGLDGLSAYRVYLDSRPEEWQVLDGFCRIPISRFYRDKGVFDRLGGDVMPRLATAAAARRAKSLRVWSAGCASGEEPYSLAMLWRLQVGPACPNVRFAATATDWDPVMLRRARAACYRPGSLSDMPAGWLASAFERRGDEFCLRPTFRQAVRFRRQDIRTEMPAGPFDLICCRNLVFTYFAESGQRRLLAEIRRRLRPGGALVLGSHERLPG